MSAISGVCYWNQEPVSTDTQTAMAVHSRAFGPDRSGSLSPHPWLVLQSHLLAFDRLSTTERQPVSFGQGSVLTWDGRLDNRDDLLMQLHNRLGDDHGDAALVAAAFERWGMDCIPQLIGDWSLAVWDAAERRIVLARDYTGNRPLYYLQRPNLFAWATSLEALTYGFQLTEPNEEYVAGSLVGMRTPELSPYADVRMLRAAHVLTSRAAGDIKVKRYWTLTPTPTLIEYRAQKDYTDHLRQLLSDAVRVRLRASRTVWAHLSGGLDSSSIVCLAHRLIANGGIETPRLQPMTWTYPNAPEFKDTEHVRDVERWCGLKTAWSPFRQGHSCATMFAPRCRPMSWFCRDQETEAVQAGDHVVLSGYFGDTVMLNTRFSRIELLDDIRRGHPVKFLRQCWTISRLHNRPIHAIVKAVLNEVRIAYSPGAGTAPPAKPRSLPGLTPAVLARVPQPALFDALVNGFSIYKRALALNLYMRLDGWTANDAITPLIWTTYPYTHRPLMEFVMAVAPMALWSPSTNRVGMKAALADVLPPSLVARVDKPPLDVSVARFRQAQTDDFNDTKHILGPAAQWEVVKRGYVDGAVLAEALAAPDSLTGEMGHLNRACVQLEPWLREIATATRRPSSDVSADKNRVLASGSLLHPATP